MTPLQQLQELLPPPAHPVEAPGALDWSRAEAELGLILPEDFKLLVSSYGTGCFDDFLYVFNPATTNPHLNLGARALVTADGFRVLRSDWPADWPFALFPEPGGLLVWGVTDNGDTLHWLTAGSPQRWPTIVMNSRAPEWHRFDLRVTSILTGLLSGRRRCRVFPGDFPSEAPAFRSLSEEASPADEKSDRT